MGEVNPLHGLIKRKLVMFPDPCHERDEPRKKEDPKDWQIMGKDPKIEQDRREQRERIDRATRQGAGLS